MSLVDELTGLSNRRGFFDIARHEMTVAQRLGQWLTLLFIDLNNMKRINDYHGHAAGDQALRDTGALLRETFRASDLIARLGGDEFCVLELGNASVGSIARLQEAVVRFNAKAGRPYEIALSIGAADFNPSEPVDLDELIARADVSMYEDKRTRKSRPRVLVVDDSPPTAGLPNSSLRGIST